MGCVRYVAHGAGRAKGEKAVLLKEWWWRVRCSVHYCIRLRSVRRWAWEAAWEGDYWPDYTPSEAVDEELSYWTD